MAFVDSARTVMSPLIYGERKRSGNMKQRRLQLEKEVADLKKTLEDEKKVHEILERAMVPNSFQFMRQIPNYLPNKTKELLAELVLVEEEVARLEEQLHKTQGGLREIKPTSVVPVPVQDSIRYNKTTNQEMQDKLPKEMKAMFFINRAIKEEHLSHNLVESKGRKSVENNMHDRKDSPRFLEQKEVIDSPRNSKILLKPPSLALSPKKVNEKPIDLHADKMLKVFQESLSKKIDSGKLTLQPNKLSERILKCLICIFQRLLRTSRVAEQEKTSNISRTSGSIFDAVNTNVKKGQQDPYGIFEIEESIRRDIGSYKNLVRFSRSSLDTKLLSTSFPLFNKLRELMDALQLVDLHVLTHNQKLAFWINVYNACIMNGFLQNGLPSNSERILMIKNKSLVNVGGIKLTPIEIEHSIMQHPSKVNNLQTRNLNREQEILVKNSYGLEKEEPNIIFALCCGTKSSPALRIYTPDRISADLEKSKLDYLQAALVVTATKRLLIPSFIHSNFMHKFEKDLEPLMQWILNQLPTSWPLRKSMVECLKLQTGIKINGFVEIMPYNDEFQYLFPVSKQFIIMGEHDPDLVRWGLHLLQDALTDHPTAPDSNSDPNYSNNRMIKEDIMRSENGHVKNQNMVENDEAIAYTLQQELEQLAKEEASGMSCDNYEPVLNQVWLNDSTGSNNRPTVGEEELETTDCSIPPDDLEDDGELDGEVGKRLNDMVATPHVPRINQQIPTFDEAMSDHERLLERLKLYDLKELKVQGDGNCQFRALSDQFYRMTEHHKFVREQVVNQLKSHPEIYKGYVPMGYDEYIKRMSKSGEWGDHVTLQAAADSYGVKIFVLTSFKDTCYIEILPVVQKSTRIIFLSFWAEVHYNSIYPEGEMFPIEYKKKKRWWHHLGI
ncbi:uncharacterized protein LOC144550682 [Carex rostrata]